VIEFLAEREVIAEVKSVLEMHSVYTAQIVTHLKLHGRKLGYLINFNVVLLKRWLQTYRVYVLISAKPSASPFSAVRKPKWRVFAPCTVFVSLPSIKLPKI
jgi:hypothetical protein